MAYYKGVPGNWITTKTGSHVFIPEDKSVKEAINEAFDKDDDETGFNNLMSGFMEDFIYASRGYIQKEINKLFELPLSDEEFSKIYTNICERKADEFLNKIRKTEPGNVEESMRKANLALQNFMDKYVEKSPDGKLYWKDDKNIRKRNSIYVSLNKNCQRCVMAWYLQYLGYDVMAKAAGPNSNEILRIKAPKSKDSYFSGSGTWDLSGFIVPDNFEYDYMGSPNEDSETQYNNIVNKVKQYPKESVFFCSIERNNKTGHVFVILHDKNGEVKFIEPQGNHYHNKNVFNNSISMRTALKRVNDLKLNGFVLPEIIQEVNKNGYRNN